MCWRDILAGYGAKVTVMLLGSSDKIKTEESNWNWSILEEKCSRLLDERWDLNPRMSESSSLEFDGRRQGIPLDVIVDGILVTGITVEIREPCIMDTVNP